MAFVIDANLDCEAVWSGVSLPGKVAHRISLYGALLAVLAPEDEDAVELWTPVAIDPARYRGPWPVRFHAGVPPRADLAWAHRQAKTANDRRLALAVAAHHGMALPGARVITSADEIDVPGPWVAKLPWTAAGRDRARGVGPPTAEQRVHLGRLLAPCGALILEPWCDRILDVGVCAHVDVSGLVIAQPPHTIVTDARGGFVGIDLAEPALSPDERTQLSTIVAGAGAAIAAEGYSGHFAIDAFAYRDGDARRFRPLCEINARLSFGWIARAYAKRLGTTRLGFGPPPPELEAARVLITPATDGITAWIA
ncbi:MAG TPA: hypothetical protein VFQ53_17050 [Kofleriaceae bacterium]|nr:hypothetical protein [Kofleriaceae bacterium]